MWIMITLYCVIAAILVVGLSLRSEIVQERKLRKHRGPAEVISIESGRRPARPLHKHA
jgi:hypothetical protein